jgi:hypothetical protein
MTTTRALTLAFAFAAVLTFTGCPSKNCSDANPAVSAVPTGCSAEAGAQVTVPVRVCPRCDQAAPTCQVSTSGIAAGAVTVEPVSEVCDPSSSCDIVPSCLTNALECTFTASMPTVGNTIQVTVVTPDQPQTFTLTLSPAGGSPAPVRCQL